MALIKCIECGKMVSEYAAACPNCGCPISIILEKSKANSGKIVEQVRKKEESPSGKVEKEENISRLVDYRSLCKIPEEILVKFGKMQNVAEEPKVPKTKCEPASNKFATANVGDYIKIGRYIQDGNIPEDIEWRILAKEGSRLLLISRYGLDRQSFHHVRENVTWETSAIRTWMNTDFIKSAFNMSEYNMIANSRIKATKNPNYKTNAGSDTWDRVFLLSMEEVEKYFSSTKDMECKPTAYAKKQGARTFLENCWWWLRTPGDRPGNITFVRAYGGIESWGCLAIDHITVVRPAMWIDLDA